MITTLHEQAASSVRVESDAIVIRIAIPETTNDADSAGLLLFAARADSFQGFMLWQRYRAVHRLWERKVAAAKINSDEVSDSFTRLYDPMCQTAASYATVAGVKQFTAEQFLDRAISCMDRVPAIGRLLRDGVLTPAWFHLALAQTDAVIDESLLDLIDAEAAERLRSAGSLSKVRVIEIVAAVVAEYDPEAARVARDAVGFGKRVVVEPLDADLSELRVAASVEDVALAVGAVNSVIAGVCAADPRSKQVRRSDAVIALLTGAVFTCQCDDSTCAARQGIDAAAQCARVVLHVIARRESVAGDSDLPAYLDGHGPISAEHARTIAGRPGTVRRDLDLGDVAGGTSQSADGYRPTATCATAVRAVHGRCVHPGCDRAAWTCDLDHVAEYNHGDPAAGGATCPCNLNPKCRFHHGLKTHVDGWLDDQIVDARGEVWTEVTTPEGITVRSRALNGWLLPELGLIPCRHRDAPSTRAPDRDIEQRRPRTRTAAKHRYRMQLRAQNRRRSTGIERNSLAVFGEPPF